MLGRTHLAIGLLTALLTVQFFTTDQRLLFIILTTLGSLLPDLDHHGSLINRILPLTRIAARLFKHRGIFHSIFPPLLILGSTPSDYALIAQALALGYTSHLFSDSFTKLGVNYLYPFSQFRIMGFIQVGTIWESIIFAAVTIAIGIVLFF